MKKLLFLGGFFTLCFADVLIKPNELPQNIQDFISTHYAATSIIKAEKDFDSYEVKLSDGTKIEFDIDSKIKEIEGVNIPNSVLPQITKDAILSQKDAVLMEIERKQNGYKLKFNNNYKVFVDQNGKILNSVLDD